MSSKPKPSTANKNEYAGRIRTAEQCWLISNLDSVLPQAYGTKRSATWPVWHAFNTHHISLGPKTKMEEVLGKFFIGVENDILFGIKTHELSALVPKIRLFRMDVDPKGKIKKDDVFEYYFPSHTDPSAVDNMIAGRSDRFPEAGIVSANWKLLGGQPAEVKRYVQVELEFFFSSMDVLITQPDPIRPYLDLFRRKSKVGSTYRLRMDVGWSIPDSKMHLFDNPRGKKIRAALAKLNRSLWLQLKSHDLNFDQSGNVKLKIEYISSLEYDLQQISIIKDTRSVSDRKTHGENVKKAKAILEKYKKCKPKNIPWGAKKGQGKGFFSMRWWANWGAAQKKKTAQQIKIYKGWEKTVASLENQVNAAKKLGQLSGMKMLQKIYKHLHEIVNPQATNVYVKRSRVFSVAVAPVELGFTAGKLTLEDNWFWKGDKTAQNIKNVPLNYGQFKKGRGKVTPWRVIKPGVNIMNSFLKGKKRKTKDSAAIKKNIEELYKQLALSKHPHNTLDLKSKLPSAVFKYCYLGDIIDAVIESCIDIYKDTDPNLNSILSNMKIVFGTITVPTYDKTGSYKELTINLNDLPVSYNLFNAWFLKNVIDPGKSSYLFKDFLRNFITQLIGACMGGNCFNKNDKDFKKFPRGRPEISFLTTRIPKGKGEIFTGSRLQQPIKLNSNNEKLMFKRRLTTAQVKTIKYTEAHPDNTDSILTNYLFINTRNDQLSARIKNRQKDIKHGIFHIDIGKADGIVKEVNFSKVDSKYQEEMLLTTSGDRRDQLDLMRRIYNADIKMFGNASFIPGQLIYIDPTIVGGGDPSGATSIARQLGLGGYYLVTGVESSISSGKFETNVKTRWTGFGSVDPRRKKDKKKKPPRVVENNTSGGPTVKGACGEAERRELLAEFALLGPEFKIKG